MQQDIQASKKAGRGRPAVLTQHERLSRIVDALEKTLAKEDLEVHSMSAIARAAGMSKRTLYSLVDSKAALAEIVIDHLRVSALDLLDLPAHDAAQATRILREFLGRWAEAALSPTVINIVRMAMDERRTFPGIAKAHFNNGSDFLIHQLTRWLTKQSRLGHLNVRSPRMASEIMWSALIARHQFAAALGYKKAPGRAQIKTDINAILSFSGVQQATT